MSEHTKTPWRLYQAGTNGTILSIYHERVDDVIHWCGFDSSHAEVGQQQANAALIVRACNSHEALKKFAEWVLRVEPENSLLALNARHALKSIA